MTRGGNSASSIFVCSIVVTCALLTMVACGGESDSQPPALGSGGDLFNANCLACHGVGASGTNQGPPLVHEIYHPGHHADFSIRNAVSRGVKQHHWFFGDMPPVVGLSSDDVEKIICYVRETQRAGGIFEGDAFETVC